MKFKQTCDIMQKVAACLGLAVRVIQAVVVNHVTGPFSGSARHQRTCNHACKQAAHLNFFSDKVKRVYIARAMVAS
jgi:hypothetical protein